MIASIYATIGDKTEFIANPKGGDTRLGVKGDWKTIEGEVVVTGIEVHDYKDFAEKFDAIKTLWPTATIRFAKSR